MIFADRYDAGKRLADKLEPFRSQETIVMAIPRGGVPIGYEIAKKLKAPLDLIIPRKLPIPYNPEAGFGAIAPDGTIVLNEQMLQYLDLPQKVIDDIANDVLKEVRRRLKAYRGDRPMPDFKNKIVIIVDDGLATGYTMIAAVRAIKKQSPKKVIVAIPVSPESSMLLLRREADEVVSLYVQKYGSFAVASFYESFPDLTDREVQDLMINAPAAASPS